MAEMHLPIHPSRRHPLTGQPLQALGFRKDGRAIWPIMGGDETTTPAGEGGGEGGGQGGNAGQAFPANTPVEQMTSDQRAAYFQHQAQKWQGRAENNYGLLRNLGVTNADEAAAIKEKVEKHDALEHELMSDKDKAVAEASQTAAADAEAKYRPMLAETAFRVAIGDRKSKEEVDDFIGDLNLTRFLTDDGSVDIAKVLARVEQFAPDKGNSPKGPVVPPRGNGGSPSGSATALTGREMYEQRHRKKSA